mmetsp:Transcript_18909/g.50337  ORF Transcript_18909/g.50337 Transcript_18909/m.50337 type:complete len:294 (+) Transcript_18909:13-894(+)
MEHGFLSGSKRRDHGSLAWSFYDAHHNVVHRRRDRSELGCRALVGREPGAQCHRPSQLPLWHRELQDLAWPVRVGGRYLLRGPRGQGGIAAHARRLAADCRATTTSDMFFGVAAADATAMASAAPGLGPVARDAADAAIASAAPGTAAPGAAAMGSAAMGSAGAMGSARFVAANTTDDAIWSTTWGSTALCATRSAAASAAAAATAAATAGARALSWAAEPCAQGAVRACSQQGLLRGDQVSTAARSRAARRPDRNPGTAECAPALRRRGRGSRSDPLAPCQCLSRRKAYMCL